jgi:hypothetical protein
MASKSTRHAITTISTALGVKQAIADSYPAGPPKTVNAMLDRVTQACADCLDLWPDELSASEIKRIHGRIKAMEQVIAPGKKAEVVTEASATMMLLLDLRDNLRGQKREAVNGLVAAYNRVIRYYDRRLDHWQAYYKAKQGVERLYSVEA